MSTCWKGLCSAWDLGEASGMSQAMETERKEKTGESGLDSSGSGWDM
jgi:hypothetical protein